MSYTVIKADGHRINPDALPIRELYRPARREGTQRKRHQEQNLPKMLNRQQQLAGDGIEEFWTLCDIDFEIKHVDRVELS